MQSVARTNGLVKRDEKFTLGCCFQLRLPRTLLFIVVGETSPLRSLTPAWGF